MSYQNGYSIIDGEIKQNAPEAPVIDYENTISVYSFKKPPAIDYHHILINDSPPIQSIYTKRCYGIDDETGTETSTPTQQCIDDHAPVIAKTLNHNILNGSSPRFAQHWRLQK